MLLETVSWLVGSARPVPKRDAQGKHEVCPQQPSCYDNLHS
jgi:hypothetical protein